MLPVRDWGMALMNMLTKSSVWTNWPFFACIRSTCSIVLFVTSAIPSVYECEAVLNVRVVFSSFINSSQKCPLNLGSRSLMIALGSPWWLTTSARKWSVTCRASVSRNGDSTTIFLNRSTHVMIVPYPSSSGSSVMKSIWICSHDPSGMGNGWYNPTSFLVSAL